MINAQIVRATPEHIAEIIPCVRQADIQEFIAVTGHTPAQVLNTGLAVSTAAWTGLINGEVVAVFGVAPSSMLCGHGIPWLVGTDALVKYQRTFLRRCRPVVNLMLSVYPTLENYIDARNHTAKAWLHWLGFKIEDPVPYGVQGLPFHRFHLEKK